MMARPSATAIMNPSTGRRRIDEIESILRETLSSQFQLSVHQTEYAGHARRLARTAAETSDIVIAIGGDGTVGDIASGIRGTDAVLGIIPTGSTNVIARGLNIPTDIRKAARLLAGPNQRKLLDAAIVGDRVALHMVGCGFDALMFEDAPQSLKRAAAWIAYVPAALKNVATRPWTFRIAVDGIEITTEARMVLVANGGYVIDPRFEVGRDIRADDGELDVIIFTPPNLAATTSVASWLAVGQIQRSAHVHQLRGKHVVIESEPAAPVELDGDVIGTTPIEVRIAPAAIPIIVPSTSDRSDRGQEVRDPASNAIPDDAEASPAIG